MLQGRVKETMYNFSPIKNPQEVVEHLEDVLIVRVDEPLYFVNTGTYKQCFPWLALKSKRGNRSAQG